MKTLILSFALALATTPGYAAEPARAATFGEHGMAMFGGNDALYAAHLPMFHAPHDYQVVLKIRLADSVLDTAVKKRLDGNTALWTIAPEKFDLERLARDADMPLQRFQADLVLGHFEQGGKTQYRRATVLVDQVLLFRKLSPEVKTSAVARYVQVGNGTQRYLIKEIDSRPDFDHIISYRASARASTLPVTVAKNGVAETEAEALAAALNALPSAIRGTVYYYTDDLR